MYERRGSFDSNTSERKKSESPATDILDINIKAIKSYLVNTFLNIMMINMMFAKREFSN